MGGTQSKKVDSEKSKNESINIKYNSNIVRNIFLETGINIFTKEKKEFMEKYEGTTKFTYLSYFERDDNDPRTIYIDFVIAHHYEGISRIFIAHDYEGISRISAATKRY